VEILYRLLDLVGNSLDLDETLATLDSELRKILPFESISVELVDGGRLMLAYAEGHAIEPCVRLKVPIQQSGWVTLTRPISKPFSDAERTILLAAAPKVAAAVENARLYRGAKSTTDIDPRTGLLNGRGLFQFLDAELARARRGHGFLGVIHCALGGFERGEAEANALFQFAARIRETCREYDGAAVSGEDLILVLGGFCSEDLAEKRSAIEHVAANSGLPHRVRMGAAFYPDDGCDAESLLAIAAQRVHSGGWACERLRRLGHSRAGSFFSPRPF
jgi:GAF domain-containing protein